MLKIDSHQHFWKFHPVRDSWINDEMNLIQRNFLPDDLYPLLSANGFDGCVAVQADQSESENDFLLALATNNDFIKGIIGWVDFEAPNFEEQLKHYSNNPLIKGFRHVLQAETQRDYMLRPAFLNGIGLLKKYNFTYDILIFPDQLKFTEQFVSRFPDQLFVLDHIAKPDIKNQKMDNWNADITALAKYPNVYCKLSGMVTEANWNGWKPTDFTPYLDVVFNAFGVRRLMYGSDWPVCLLAGGYKPALEIIQQYSAQLTTNEQALLFGGNAVRFYRLNQQ